ncbi:DUF6270 domain-containing protein [Peribacillus butanolivorans]|uniref:DUF6270 domain-containing protein n=1 Tax=Peribacillus butanolivorans TaxID=421767 RepID=UPI00380314A1
MTSLVTNLGYSNGVLSIKGTAEVSLEESCTLCIRRREIEHGLEYPEEYSFPLNINSSEFVFEKDINTLLQGISLNNEMIWDLFLLSGDDYFKLETDKQLKLDTNDYVSLDNKQFKVKPYITGENGVSIFVLKNDIQGTVGNASFNGGVFNLSVQMSNSAILKQEDWNNYSIRLMVKKREQEHLFEYYDSMIIEPVSGVNPLNFSLNINDLFENYKLNKKLIWDLFIEVTSKDGLVVETPLLCSSGTKGLFNFNYFNFSHNDLYRIKPYVTGKNSIALLIRPSELKIDLSQLKFENNTMHLLGTVSSPEYDVWNFDELESYLIIKKRYTVGKENIYYTEKVSHLSLLNAHFQAELSVTELLNDEVIHHGDVWDMFVRLTTLDGRIIDVMVKPLEDLKKEKFTYEIMSSNPSYKFKPYVNGLGNFSLYFIDSNKPSHNAVKIAVLGSCFSRNPFNSTNYFNPTYKQNYKCVLTQFHSSIISMVSNPMQIDVAKMDDVTEYNKYFIQSDFEKNFFDQIKELRPEYLIVDLYADAARDIIKINDDTIVSASLALRQSKYFKEFMEYEVVTHDNNDTYFALWKEAMIQFAEKIKEYLPEDRIILNIGGFTSTYYDEDGSIKRFPRDHIIQRNNYFWDKLNSWFMQCIPGCKVINLKDTKYIGQHDHPFGKTFSHYQSGYYKEFMNRLNKLVMQDLQSDRQVQENKQLIKA